LHVAPSSGPASAVAPLPLQYRQQKEWFTAEEAADYLSVKVGTIQCWARTGKLKGHILSGTVRHRWRFRREDLDAMLVSPSTFLPKGGDN